MKSGDRAASPVQVPAAYGVVVAHIKRAIHLGVYSPGERLPAERAHAKQLGVSRVTLREALRVLEGEGYITMRRGASGGATVVAQSGSRAKLRERLDELLATQEFRIATEGLAARRAATRASAEDIAALERTIATVRDDVSEQDFRRADSDFHLLIAEIADSALLGKAVEEGRAALFPQIDLLDFERGTASVIRDHQRIVEALREGDAAKAEKRMAAHIEKTTKEFLAILDEGD